MTEFEINSMDYIAIRQNAAELRARTLKDMNKWIGARFRAWTASAAHFLADPRRAL